MAVCLAISKAVTSPVSVTMRVRSLSSRGIVNVGDFIGRIIVDKTSPVTMLPRVSRIIEFNSCGLFSFVGVRVCVRGLVIWT